MLVDKLLDSSCIGMGRGWQANNSRGKSERENRCDVLYGGLLFVVTACCDWFRWSQHAVTLRSIDTREELLHHVVALGCSL